MRRLLICLPTLLLLPAAARQEPEQPLGSASRIELGEQELIRLPAGTRLLAAPDPWAPVELTLPAETELPVVARSEGWARVRLGNRKLWVDLAGGPATGSTAASSSLPPAAAPEPTGRPDPERVARARRILGLEEPAGQLGAFALHTDVTKRPTLELFAAVAAELPTAYARRYGVEVSAPLGAVLLFAAEESFREYESTEASVRDLGTSGHAGHGVAALFLGRRPAAEVAPILVHELTHLLNRQALGQRSPAWLEEGIATDLSYSQIGRGGRLRPELLGGASIVTEEPALTRSGRVGVRRNLHLTGARASLNQLRKAIARRQAEPLQQLLDLPLQEFMQPELRTLRYSQSAFLVRFLLDGQRGRMAPAFRGYIGSLVDGVPYDPEALPRHLGLSWTDLEEAFERWLAGLRL